MIPLLLAAAAAAAVLLAGPAVRSPLPAPAARRRRVAAPARLPLVAAVAAVLAGVTVGSPLLVGPGAMTALLGGRLAAGLRRRRDVLGRRAEVAAFVDALTRSVRSGATLAGAVAEAHRAAVAPSLGPELQLVRARIDAGEPFAVVVDEWAGGSDDADLRLLAGTVAVLASTGGAAAPALDATARSVRARLAAAEEVRALAAQAVASAAVLVTAPAVFAVVLASVDRRLAAFLLRDPAGALCVAVALALDGVGLWWMQRTIDAGAP